MSEKKIIKNKEFPSFLNSLAKDLIKYYYSKLNKKFKVNNKLKGKGYSMYLNDPSLESFLHGRTQLKRN